VIEPVYIYAAQAYRIVDGDTYVLDVDLGFGSFQRIPVRLHGCNAPELSTREGKDAKDFVSALLLTPVGPAPLVLQSFRHEQSFARWVCDVWLPSDENLSEALIAAGHAVPLRV